MNPARAPGGFALAAAAVSAVLIAASPADVPGCRLEDTSTSQLRIYECQQKLRIAAEAATRLSAIQSNGRLVGVRVEGGAVMVDTSGRPGSFQIVTAQAVTETQAGRVAVDTSPAGTSVLVRDGSATVGRQGSSVALRAGQGVDVAAPPPSSGPGPATRSAGIVGLQARTWGADRAGRLMARLGER